MMPAEKSGAQGATGVACCRLDPDFFERTVAQDAAVADAVERNAARQTQLPLPRQVVRMSGYPQHDFFSHRLDRARDVEMALRQFAFRLSPRPAEQTVEGTVRHGEAG